MHFIEVRLPGFYTVAVTHMRVVVVSLSGFFISGSVLSHGAVLRPSTPKVSWGSLHDYTYNTHFARQSFEWPCESVRLAYKEVC
ncbi:hypothetical protein MNBD_DELTA01-2021 [hydrothermal vent metagenome]|uniref:Uncharacterized protein n=1 Tax=hydrothermal vent metagenome TaxID=652676 RepID=A0A3B0RPY9_9ZZZZ